MRKVLPYSLAGAESVSKTKVTFSYIRDNVMDSELWSNLHTNRAAQELESCVRRHFSEYGANIVERIMDRFSATPELIEKLKKARKN